MFKFPVEPSVLRVPREPASIQRQGEGPALGGARKNRFHARTKVRKTGNENTETKTKAKKKIQKQNRNKNINKTKTETNAETNAETDTKQKQIQTHKKTQRQTLITKVLSTFIERKVEQTGFNRLLIKRTKRKNCRQINRLKEVYT